MKKIILIFILSFFTIGGVFASGWLAGNGKNWIAKPDDDRRFGSIVTIDGVEAYKDIFTGLYWEAKPSKNFILGNEAVNYCKSKGNAWRLPEIKELQTIITYNKKNKNDAYTSHPNIDNFYYWSSTLYYINRDDYFFLVSFHSGYVNFRYYIPDNNYGYYAICVHN